tara:strand:- start:76 stop:525 length:450 start_codon:yes stop_codon:yes gene_type:complete
MIYKGLVLKTTIYNISLYMIDTYSIFIKHDRTYCIYDINNTISLNRLKYIISDKIKVPVHQFYMVCGGKIIDNIETIKLNPTIEEYNKNIRYPIEKDRTLFIHINGYENFYKKLLYFFYENRCSLLNIDTVQNENTDQSILNIQVMLNK